MEIVQFCNNIAIAALGAAQLRKYSISRHVDSAKTPGSEYNEDDFNWS